MVDDFPDGPNSPIGDNQRDERFHLDFRDSESPIKEGVEEAVDEYVGLPPSEDTVTGEGGMADFTPHQQEAMGLPLLKACIMDEGETDFTEQIGRIYWRKEGEHTPDCDPCQPETQSKWGSGSGSGGSGSSGEDGETKCCIIEVPEWFWESRYTALFCMESAEVRFEDFVEVQLIGRYTYTQLDPRYVVVCDPETIMVRSVQGEKPGAYGATISKGKILEIDAGFFWWLKSKRVRVSLTGIRRGFGKNPSKDPFSAVRFPKRTKKQFDKNEEFLKQATDLEGDHT